MTYPLRIEEVGAYYHVNTKAVAGVRLFASDEDRLEFLMLLGIEIERSQWRCLSYCLMRNHFHLLLRLDECTLSSGMQHLKSLYARSYNKAYNRRGALFQRRFHDRLIETDSHLLETVRYIARNAPRVNSAVSAEDYVWCSYGASIDPHDNDPLVDMRELLGLFGSRPGVARTRLRAFVEEPDPRKRRCQTRV